MQKKIYFGGLPWETDRIGLLNYFKAVLEGNDVVASYELPFVSSPLVNPNSTLRVTDVFVALDRKTRKSRGFGFVTVEVVSGDADDMLNKIIDMMQGKIMIGIRGPRELIVKEADPRDESEDMPASRDREEDKDSSEADAMGLNW